jgi:hypothetical protein
VILGLYPLAFRPVPPKPSLGLVLDKWNILEVTTPKFSSICVDSKKN